MHQPLRTFGMTLVSLLFLMNLPLLAQTPKVLPETKVLGPTKAGGKLALRTVESAPTPGTALLRRVSKDGSFTFYEGRIKPKAWEQVSLFHPTIGESWDMLRIRRAFAGNPETGAPEIIDLYSDGRIWLVGGNLDTLYVESSAGPIPLPRLDRKPFRLQVRTEPVPANIHINGESFGKAPLDLPYAGATHLWIRLDREGFLPWETLLVASDRQDVVLSARLAEIPRFADGTPLPAVLSANGSLDFHQAMKKESALATSRKPESIRDLATVREYIDSLINRQYGHYLSPSYLKVQPWDSLQNGLPVRMWYGENNFDFGFEGLLPCSREESTIYAKLLSDVHAQTHLKSSLRSKRQSWPGGPDQSAPIGMLLLSHRNRLADAFTMSRPVQRYYLLESIRLVMADRTVAIPGSFYLPAYLRNSKQWKALSDPFGAADIMRARDFD